MSQKRNEGDLAVLNINYKTKRRSKMADEVKEKRAKKLSKSIEGTVLTITESTTGTVIKVDFAKLPVS